jgi:CSLREA domain-containing protein
VLSGEVVGRRRGGVLVAALMALACCALMGASVATAEEFVVDSTADEVDVAPGDENCQTAAEECTLRAAIEEGDGLGVFTRIDFDEEIFAGQAAATIELSGSLPALTVPGFINGRSCEFAAEVSGPCVGIDGPSGEPALIVRNAEEVEISGLAMTGAQTAISLEGSPSSKVRGSWLGVALDGTVVGNATGVLVDSGSNRSFIGGEGPEQGNVFAGNASDGLDIHGSSNVRVLGNYFGVEPDGVTAAANGGDAVEVASTKVLESGGTEITIESSGTEIGTRVSAAAVASPLCDRGCNVISGAASQGVDLQGDGGSEAPAASTYIAGNYIGLDAVGTAAVPNAVAGVNVGAAAHTTVGGPSRGEANRINGGSAAVLAGPVANKLAVRGNIIGTDATGAEPLAPPDDGIVVDSGEVGSPAVEAEITGNLIGMEDGVAILQRGAGAWIFDNEISGSQTGIRAVGSNSFYGNVIEGNLIEGPASSGILVENDFNEIVGNEVFGAGGAGIWIQGSLLEAGVSGNLVGGDVAADENVIDGSGGAAIEISNIEATNNEVARNRGAGNSGPFIDLVAVSPGTEVGPNRGIEPPTFSTSTESGASGGAVEGATVRIFRKQLSAAGELESFLGEAVVDSAGGWELTYDAAIPAGTIIAATQTKDGSTSELAVAGTGGVIEDGGCAFIGGPECTDGNGGAGGSGTETSVGTRIERVRPQTRIVRARARRHTARFVFESDQAGSTFLCKLDGKPFDLCRSPKRYVGLAPGKHVFWVRAIDPGGRVDLSPVKKKFVVPG